MPKTLGELLRILLDETDIPRHARRFTRKEWAEILDCPLTELSRWTTDESLPSPEHLSSIIMFVSDEGRVSVAAWESFSDIPLRKAVPHLARFKVPEVQPAITTVGMYALWPLYKAVLRRMGIFTYRRQVELLDHFVVKLNEGGRDQYFNKAFG